MQAATTLSQSHTGCGRVLSHSLASSRGSPAVLPAQLRLYARSRRGRVTPVAALLPDQLVDLHHHLQPLASSLLDHVFLAYERVVLPCHNLGCGDVVHRSTLDPVLRLEEKGINPKGVALVLVALSYLLARPGVLQGAIDYYILDKWSRFSETLRLGPANFRLGKKLAEGGFGQVYRADLVTDDRAEPEPVIVKQAKEFGEAEVWMNERLMRAAPKYFAKFITAFEEDQSEILNPTQVKSGANRSEDDENPLWLIWRYEGDYTLWDIMTNKNRSREPFPYCMEELLFGESLEGPKDARRRQATVRLVLQQVLEALRACHDTGIVHRDVKPQNVIMSTKDNRAKLIDLGAAADLRVGINYVPSEFLLDPRYAPPQQYIMSTSTPRAPPLPVAALLSPILWKLNSPDRFDMYSVGILVLQLAFPALRNDDKLIAFRKRLESQAFDLEVWRQWYERRHPREAAEGFDLLDLDDGAMWDLCKQLMAYKPSERMSSSLALQHPTFTNLSPLAAFSKIGNLIQSAGQAMDGNWVSDALGGSARAEGALTEAQLSDELGPDYREMPPALRNARNTISWWQARQGAMKRAASSRRRDQQRQGTQPVPQLAAQPINNGAKALGNALPSMGQNGAGQAPDSIKRRPRKVSPNFMPWRKQSSEEHAESTEEQSIAVQEPPVQQMQPRKRREGPFASLQPLMSKLQPQQQQQKQEEQQQQSTEGQLIEVEEPPVQQAQPRKRREGPFSGLQPLFSKLQQQQQREEEEETIPEVFEEEPEPAGRRSNGRSNFPKKLLPWLRTTSA